MPLHGLGFFPPGPNVGREANLLQRVAHFRVVVPFVQTHPLRALLRRAGAFDYQAVHGLLDQLHVMPIGARHSQADRDPLGFGQQAAVDAPFGAVGRMGAGFFPRRAALSSSLPPYSTRATRSPSNPHTVPPRLSTTLAIPRRPPILETAHAPWKGDTTRSVSHAPH